MVVVVAFSSLARIWGEGHSFIPRLRFFFFFKWESARAQQFHFLGKDQSTVAQRAKTAVAECSMTSCV